MNKKTFACILIAVLAFYACSGDSNPDEQPENPIGLCADFDQDEQISHQGKMKKQICDERDGKKYPYVQIGSQTWMAKNLEYEGEDGAMGRCALANQENCDIYGRLYTLNEMFCSDCEEQQWGVADPNALVNNIACPAGWHLPSTVEMEELWTYADPNFIPGSEAMGTGNNSSATKLKATSWNNGNGTDEYGFAALPGGYCGDGCTNVAGNNAAGGTRQFGVMSFWWSHAFGYPVPLAKSWRITAVVAAGGGGPTVDDAFQSYSTSAFYVRCLKNSNPSSKSPETSPQSLPCDGSGTESQICHFGEWKDYFTDNRDGEKYPYVEIGSKTWMAKNLNFNAEGSVCYNGLNENCNTYGRLYNWNVAMAGEASSNANPSGVNGVCPDGWHLPSNAEWDALMLAFGGTGTGNLIGAGVKLKAKSGWIENGTDELGFAALPGSYGVLRAGNIGNAIDFGTSRGSFWWGTVQQNANGARMYYVGPTADDAKRIDNDKSRFYSVRCVRD